MPRQFSGLIDLIAFNREAMDYYKSLPDNIKCQLSKRPERVTSMEQLRDEASALKLHS